MRSLLLLIVGLFQCGFAQDLRKDLDLLLNNRKENYAFRIDYENALLGQSSVTSGSIVMVKMGDVYYMKQSSQVEYFLDKEYVVIVDHEGKTIFVDVNPSSYLKGLEQSTGQLDQMVKFLEVPHQISYSKLSESIVKYSVSYDSGQYDSLVLVIDRRANVLNSQNIYYRTLANGQPGKPVTMVRVTLLNTEAFSTNLTRESYISVASGMCKLNSRYLSYTVLKLPAQ